MKGRVKKEVVEECEVLEGLEDAEKTWYMRSVNDECREVVRGYLKRIGKRKYYNRIPVILGKLGYSVLVRTERSDVNHDCRKGIRGRNIWKC